MHSDFTSEHLRLRHLCLGLDEKWYIVDVHPWISSTPEFLEFRLLRLQRKQTQLLSGKSVRRAVIRLTPLRAQQQQSLRLLRALLRGLRRNQ